MHLRHFFDKNLRLRRCENEDARLIYTIENDPILGQSNTLYEPLAHFQAREIVSAGHSELASNGFLLLVIELVEQEISPCKYEHTNAITKTIGVAQIYNFDFINRRAAIGIVLFPNFHRLGYGKRVLTMLLSYSFKALSLRQVYAEIFPDNIAAQNCFEQLGFQLKATLPNWYKTDDGYKDLNIFVLTKSQYFYGL